MNSGPPGRQTGAVDGSPDGWGGAGFTTPTPEFDAELGQIFVRMRSLLGLSLWDMARAVGAEPGLIANLEAGAVGALPPWPEPTQLVNAYAVLVGIDPQPILARITRGLGVDPSTAAKRIDTLNATTAPPFRPAPPRISHAVQSDYQTIRPTIRPTAPPQRIVTQPPVARTQPTQRRLALPRPEPVEVVTLAVGQRPSSRAILSIGRGLWRVVRRHARAGLLLLVPPVLLVLTWLFPEVVYAAIGRLPAVIGQPLHNGADLFVNALAPVHDGLTWIEFDDPKVRKGGRLDGKTSSPGR